MAQSNVAIARYQRRTRWGWMGLALQPMAILVMGSLNELDAMSWRGIMGLCVFLISIVLMNMGIWNYAKAKGYGNWVAALSVLNIYGLLVLICLPKRSR